MSLDHPRGLIIAAPRSGAGKTTVTLGLLRALRRAGVAVQPFKCGPDYIDPAFHAAAAGRASFNLDTWAMRRGLIGHLIRVAAADADLCLVEGVMGLFDGVAAAGQCGRGSTADLAALTGWPVVLVLDVSGQTETAAAVALGCRAYRTDVQIAGVILNCMASARHEALIRGAFDAIDMPVLGAICRSGAMMLPERHLGLVQATETDNIDLRLDGIADAVTAQVPLDTLRAIATRVAAIPNRPTAPLPPPGQRVAVAQDRAFSFLYPHIVAGWRAAGAEVVPFSPLADEPPDGTADAVWLPGGYPELHAAILASAVCFKHGLRAAAVNGVPIHGECGGYMVLGAGLEDGDGLRHEMAGLLGLETSFASRKLHLGYRRARGIDRPPPGLGGGTLMGHEFHYATITLCRDDPLFDVTDASGQMLPERGSRRGPVTGTFFHVIDGEAA